MKKSVIAIIPNPALDLSGWVQNLKPNEKSYVYDEQRAPGGNSINAARILKRLKVPVVITGFAGGSTGQEIAELLAQERVQFKFISIQGNTRINVTVSERIRHLQTRLSFPGPSIRRTEARRLFQLLSRQKNVSCLVVGGSLPPGFTETDVAKIIRYARKKGVPVIVDCPGDILNKVLVTRPTVIKPNLEEFHILTGSRAKTIAGVAKKASELLQYVPYICVSSVEGGALLVTQEATYFGKVPALKVRSAVGAGDSMVGAMAALIHAGNFSGEELLRQGLAAAASTLVETGTVLGRPEVMKSMYNKIQIIGIKRR